MSGPELLRIYGPVLVCAANGKGIQPRETDFDIHFCATGKAMRTGGAARPCQGPGSLVGPLQLCFGGGCLSQRQDDSPRHGRETRSIFLVES